MPEVLARSIIFRGSVMWRVGLFLCLLWTAVVGGPVTAENDFKVCESDQCKAAADYIKSAMNSSEDPCNDFYGYACGSWASNNLLPNGEDVWNLHKAMENYIQYLILGILQEEEDTADVTPLKYEKLFFKSCMDTDKIEDIGVQPLKEIVDYFGGWPIAMNSSDWEDAARDWQNIHDYYSTFKGLSSIFDIFVHFDHRNNSRNAIEINKPTKTLYDELLKKVDEATATQKYTDLIRNVVAAFLQSTNKSLSEDDISKDIEDLVNFEKSLHSLKVSANETEDMESPRIYMTIEELQNFYDEANPIKSTSKINWLQTILALFKKVNELENEERIIINALEEVGVGDKYFLHNLLHLLDETPNRVIVNYVHWKFISSSLKYTNKQMRDLYAQATATSENPEKSEETRSETCRSDMRMGVGYRYEFIKRYLSEDTRKMASDIVSEMRSEMLDEMEHSTWLDDDTKEETMIKLHALKWLVAGSNFFLRREYLEHVYNGLTITSNYFDNVQNGREFGMNRGLKRLRHSQNPAKFIRVDPLTAKALYDSRRRTIILTAAQLLSPLFHSSLPLAVNYGYIAPTIGQLMSRTLEKEVDTNKYMSPWSDYLGDTYKSYDPKTQCLIRQYSNYSVGPSTIDENMYDAIGIKAAYNAFRDSFITETVEKLPGLENLSEDQLFFVSYAVEYCQTATSKYRDEHDPAFYTPNEYRVIGTLSNSQQFAKAFGCPVNTFMNPANKCTL